MYSTWISRPDGHRGAAQGLQGGPPRAGWVGLARGGTRQPGLVFAGPVPRDRVLRTRPDRGLAGNERSERSHGSQCDICTRGCLEAGTRVDMTSEVVECATGPAALPGGRCAAARNRPDRRRLYGAGGFVDLKLDHHTDGMGSRSSTSRARSTSTPRHGCASCSSNWSTMGIPARVNMEKVELLDSTGLGCPGRRGSGASGARRVAGPGVHPGAHPQDLPDHRPDQGLRHPRPVDEAIAARKSE